MRAVLKLARNRSGAAAIEFALISVPMIMTIVFVLIVGLIVYEQEALDFATAKAARQIMTGQVQQNGTAQGAFRTLVLCPYLPATMACGNVIINVQTITPGAQPGGYYALVNAGATALNMPTLSVDANAFSLGVAGSYEYVQVVYPVTFIPSFFARILGGSTFNGSPAFLLMSTAAFKNEQYS